MQRLTDGAAALGTDLSPDQIAQFELYRDELLAWNRTMNLTAITAPDEVATKLFLDSLTVFLALPQGLTPATRLVDVGTGAGIPGIPLKIVCPDLPLTLVEATRKKARFLEHLVERLKLSRVQIVVARAEDTAHVAEHREAYQVVTARALARLPITVELTLPFCAVGGVVVVPAKGDFGPDVERASGAVERLGGHIRECRPVAVPWLNDGRALVIIDKVSPSPEAFPRRAGVPAKRPLA